MPWKHKHAEKEEMRRARVIYLFSLGRIVSEITIIIGFFILLFILLKR